MRRVVAISWVLLSGLSACTCARPPEPAAPPPPEKVEPGSDPKADAPPLPGLRGQVVLASRRADGTFPAVEIRVAPEAEMIAFVERRLREARSTMDRLSAERERAQREARVALAEADRTDQEWKATTANDLYRRVEIHLRGPRDPAKVAQAQDELLARKKASYRRAAQAARRSDDKERAFVELEREAGRYRDARFFTQGLPLPVHVSRADASGTFEMALPPGRYALAALPEPVPGVGTTTDGWLLWVQVREGAPEILVLDGTNRHGTGCDACVVSPKEMP